MKHDSLNINIYPPLTFKTFGLELQALFIIQSNTDSCEHLEEKIAKNILHYTCIKTIIFISHTKVTEASRLQIFKVYCSQ